MVLSASFFKSWIDALDEKIDFRVIANKVVS